MEVMHRAIVKSRSLKPLPGEITNQRINDATLPVKIEAARRAIAECTDLPELLRYKSQAEGLAAAVRTMKEVGPAMIRSANEMMADAWRKGGELLSQYNGSPIAVFTEGKAKSLVNLKSPRTELANSLGVSVAESICMVRISRAPKEKVYEAVGKSKGLKKVASQMPALRAKCDSKKVYSDALRNVMGSDSGKGLTTALSAVRRVSLESFQHLTPDERKVVKAKITEIVELLDEMDRLCR